MNLFMETTMKKHFFTEIKPHNRYSKSRKHTHSKVKKDRRIRTKLRSLARNNHDASSIDFEVPFTQKMQVDEECEDAMEHYSYGSSSHFGASSRMTRFLDSRIGCSWDDVYSEIRERLNVSNYLESKILDYLREEVLNIGRSSSRSSSKYSVETGLLQYRKKYVST